TDLVQRAPALFVALLDAIPDQDSGSLREQARAIQALVKPVPALFGRVHALTLLLQSVALTDEETRANDLLKSLASSGAVDFADLERRLREEIPGADPWLLLRALVQKSRARLKVE